MSLINEALKRVSEADRGKPQKTDFEARAMQPAPSERRASPLLWVTIPALLLGVGIALGGLLLAKVSQRQSLSTQVAPPVATAPIAEKSGPAPQTQPAETEPPVASVPAPVVEQPKPSPSPTPTPVEVVASAAPQAVAPSPAVAAAPTFRLKGILYSKNPTALINNSSVQTGGEIDGATVTKIDRTTVTLEFEGKTTLLKLGGQ